MIYVRISRDRVGAGLGVERQEHECRELAERLGLDVVGVYPDNDLSAYSGKRRPNYEALLEDLQAGRAEAVIAWHMDRLHRSPAELERYITICDPLRIPTFTVMAGELDLSTASGRMNARVTGAVARHESEQKGERVRSQKRQAQANGRWLGGRRPFGFAADGVTVRPSAEQLHKIHRRMADLYGQAMPSPGELTALAARLTAEADALEEATRRVLAGDSMRGILTAWNERGLCTTTGARWNGSSFRQLLLRPRNAGLVGTRTSGADASGTAKPKRARERVLGKASWPAIVDRETWEALRVMLTDPARRLHDGKTSRRLLGSALYRCGICGLKARSGGSRAKGPGRYQCPEGHVTRIAGAIDDLVFDVLEGLLRKNKIKVKLKVPDLFPLYDRLALLNAKSDEIASVFSDPDSGMTSAQFKISNDRLQHEIAQIQAEIGRLSGGNALVGIVDAPDPVRAFHAADIERKRRVIDHLMTVRIMPTSPGRRPGGRYFDPRSVMFEMKV